MALYRREVRSAPRRRRALWTKQVVTTGSIIKRRRRVLPILPEVKIQRRRPKIIAGVKAPTPFVLPQRRRLRVRLQPYVEQLFTTRFVVAKAIPASPPPKRARRPRRFTFVPRKQRRRGLFTATTVVVTGTLRKRTRYRLSILAIKTRPRRRRFTLTKTIVVTAGTLRKRMRRYPKSVVRVLVRKRRRLITGKFALATLRKRTRRRLANAPTRKRVRSRRLVFTKTTQVLSATLRKRSRRGPTRRAFYRATLRYRLILTRGHQLLKRTRTKVRVTKLFARAIRRRVVPLTAGKQMVFKRLRRRTWSPIRVQNRQHRRRITPVKHFGAFVWNHNRRLQVQLEPRWMIKAWRRHAALMKGPFVLLEPREGGIRATARSLSARAYRSLSARADRGISARGKEDYA